MDPASREQSLRARLEQIAQLEAEVARREQELRDKERELKTREKAKKQILLRLTPSIWNEIAAMAEEEFRSINGEIEFLLAEAIRRRRGK